MNRVNFKWEFVSALIEDDKTKKNEWFVGLKGFSYSNSNEFYVFKFSKEDKIEERNGN